MSTATETTDAIVETDSIVRNVSRLANPQRGQSPKHGLTRDRTSQVPCTFAKIASVFAVFEGLSLRRSLRRDVGVLGGAFAVVFARGLPSGGL
ncbi:MAG UNVERIFIED_CONTAM: hypothetical protein LVR18_31370 [Planctomycetaceae bacterium]